MTDEFPPVPEGYMAVEARFSTVITGEVGIVTTPLGFGGPALILDFAQESTDQLAILRIQSGGLGDQPVETALEVLDMATTALQKVQERAAAEKAAEVDE